MKKIMMAAMLVLQATAYGQIKSVSQLITLSGKNYTQVVASMETGYWQKFEDGKMDTLSYTRWVPKNIDETNAGDNIMCFYRKKDKHINYIVMQTRRIAFRDLARAEAKKNNYKLLGHDKKNGTETESYLLGHCNVTIFAGKERPDDAISYLIGAKMLD